MPYNLGSEVICKALSNGVVNTEIDTYAYMGWITVWATLLPAAAAPVTLNFETAPSDAADETIPDAAAWTPISQELVCDAAGSPVSLTLDPTDPNFNALEGLHAWVRIDCRNRFLRLAAVPADCVVVAMADQRRGYPV